LPNDYKIQVYEKEEGVVYEIDTKRFEKNAKYFHFKNKKDDHRAQIFCPRRFWEKMSKTDQEIRDAYFKYCF